MHLYSSIRYLYGHAGYVLSPVSIEQKIYSLQLNLQKENGDIKSQIVHLDESTTYYLNT